MLVGTISLVTRLQHRAPVKALGYLTSAERDALEPRVAARGARWSVSRRRVGSKRELWLPPVKIASCRLSVLAPAFLQ